MNLSVIIVSWNVRERLRTCLASLFRETKDLNWEIFVIDNDSKDGSAEMVLNDFPDVQLIVNKKNLGFAAASNQGIKKARGEFILLLNPDTELKENSFAKTVEYMRSHPEVGILGPRILNFDGSLQPSVRRFPTLISQILIILKIPHLWPSLAPIKYYLAADFDYEKEANVDQVMGACLLFSRNLLNKIGLLDDKFFIWFEEVDFCQRARNAGFKVRYAPVTSITHWGGESFAQEMTLKKQKMISQSMAYYFKKHHSFAAYLFIKFLTLPIIFLAIFSEKLRRLI